jgi:hypothetical protein
MRLISYWGRNLLVPYFAPEQGRIVKASRRTTFFRLL